MFFDHEHCVCNDKMNSEKHLYVEMDDVEKKRRGEDLLYCILMDPDSTKLTEVCVFFVKQIKEKYPTRSNRFDVTEGARVPTYPTASRPKLVFFLVFLDILGSDFFR